MSLRVCSICKSPGVTKSTCPLNKNAKNKNRNLHINATHQINLYLKNKERQQNKPINKPINKLLTKQLDYSPK